MGTGFFNAFNQEKYETITKEIPHPHIHYAISILYHFLNKILGPFNFETRDSFAFSEFHNEESKFKYQRLLFSYLSNSLKYWNKDLNNASQLADLGAVWMTYIRPWAVNLA
jgi:hypothetical protein